MNSRRLCTHGQGVSSRRSPSPPVLFVDLRGSFQVSSYFPPKTMWRSFWCAICTALVLESIDPFQTGKLVQFAISINRWQWFEIFPMILLGAMGGMMGALFIKLNVRFTQFRKGSRWLRARPTQEVLILAFVTAVISFPNLFMRGNSGSLLAQLFSNCNDVSVAADDDRNQGSDSVISALCDHDEYPWGNMGWIMVACAFKFLLTTVTYGSAIPSGVFMPSLCVGALMGRVVGWLMFEWHQSVGDTFIFSVCAGKTNCINPALYAVIGAASVLGGITRMTGQFECKESVCGWLFGCACLLLIALCSSFTLLFACSLPRRHYVRGE
jgi:chloride channel 3/4/5